MADTGLGGDGTVGASRGGTGGASDEAFGESASNPARNSDVIPQPRLFPAATAWGSQGADESLLGQRIDTGDHQDFSAQWAVPWSDLMMVMFVSFFMLTFAIFFTFVFSVSTHGIYRGSTLANQNSLMSAQPATSEMYPLICAASNAQICAQARASPFRPFCVK